MKDANQVCKEGFPDAKFKFVHEVDDHHPGNIKIFSNPLKKGILYHIWSVRYALSIDGRGERSQQWVPRMST